MLFEISKPKFSVIESVLRNFLEIFEILSGKMDVEIKYEVSLGIFCLFPSLKFITAKKSYNKI